MGDKTVYDCFVNIFLFEIICIMYMLLFLNLLLLQHVHGEEVVDVDEQGGVTTEFPTEPPVEMMKCYKCDSKQGPCSDQEFGVEGDCPKVNGCSISKGDGVMLRSCGNSNNDFKCDTVNEGGMELQYCNCRSDLCNKDWGSAGNGGGARMIGLGYIAVFFIVALAL